MRKIAEAAVAQSAKSALHGIARTRNVCPSPRVHTRPASPPGRPRLFTKACVGSRK